MRLIHCTRKLLKASGVLLTDPKAVPAAPEGLGNWYANLLKFNRAKCLLFSSEKTLYSFLIPGILKKDLQDIKGLFINHLSSNLRHEGFHPESVSRLLQEYQDIGFAKTDSRKILGFMNDFAFQYRVFIRQAGGIENLPLLETNTKINRTPLRAEKEFFYPIEKVSELISKQS